MNTIIIKARKNSDAALLLQIAEKFNLSTRMLNEEDGEDIALVRAIDEAMKEKSLPVQTARNILNNVDQFQLR
ncbi:MAG: hypothetical protein HYY40_11680 [Bacteroidetes bacterium]|nr:hypothetical protein [Bacteroidota bacterium]